jgi:hypothetical protein
LPPAWIEGAPLRLEAEMSRVDDDRLNLHVLPIVRRGPTENLNSLLYLRSVDLIQGLRPAVGPPALLGLTRILSPMTDVKLAEPCS